MHRRLTLTLLLSVCYLFSLHAQEKLAVVDSIYKLYQSEKDLNLRTSFAGKLSLLYLSVDRAKSDSFANLAIEHAELSRDRATMAKAYRYNGDRYANMASRKEYIPKAIDFYTRSYNLARASKLDKEMVTALLGMASVYRNIPDADKAMNHTAQAFALVSGSGLDSLEARCYISFGSNYMVKKEKLLALKNFFNALKIAEIKKDPQLLRDCYLTLSQFYFTVEHYDKALDYVVKASDKLEDIKDANARYARVSDLNLMGSLFVQKKQFDLAKKTYDDAIAVAEKLKYDPLKLTSYISIFNMYLLAEKPAEALKFFNGKPELKDYMNRTGFSGVIDHAYAYAYRDMGMLDSAGYYFKKALPFFSQQLNNLNNIHFFDHYAKYQFMAKNYDEAIRLLNNASATAKQMNDLEWQEKIYKELDSAYQLKGDYKTALFYANTAQHLKDTLQLLGKEDDILQLQLADEDDRRARLLKEEEELRKRSHQYQYFGITIGIAVLFVMLVMMGTFKVSAGTIRIVGFFTFLMLFEFIFLLLKKNFYAFTHGEPWKDLTVMIGLAALLLPLHHWVEHKVIHYLTTKQLIRIDKSKYLIGRLFTKNKMTKQVNDLLQ
jgi:hypothetical protein